VTGSDAAAAAMLIAALAALAAEIAAYLAARARHSKPPPRVGHTPSWWPPDQSTPDPAGPRDRCDPELRAQRAGTPTRHRTH
jgi:hypothetical protein